MKQFNYLIVIIVLASFLVAAVPFDFNGNVIDIRNEQVSASTLGKKPPPCFPFCKYKQGEPGMEKIAYFHYIYLSKPSWGNAYKYDGYFNAGCFTWYYRIETYKLPVGCNFRYQY